MGEGLARDLLTALALLFILEGLLPALAPKKWLQAMQDAARLGPRGIRVIGISALLAGAILLNLVR